ncbi:MAG: hypothetical protein KKA73_19595 [Chloroflexi bacterium]|nr:hypothetical protein [Chloroflexota bacterium]MBU1749892.1 hypothetical protein [Chloroflexota bacterium]
MKTIYAGLLIWLLLALLLAGCDVSVPVSTSAAADTNGDYVSAYLSTSYPEALSVMNQLVLGSLELEGTADAVTAAQAQALLPLWQAFQGSALRDNAERNAALAAIEKAMTPAQLQAIAVMQLTGTDLQTWAQEQGVSFGAPGGGQGTGPSTDAQATAQARFGNMTEAERAAMRATAQAGGGFSGGQRTGGQGAGGTRTGSSSAGTSNALLNPLLALLTQRAGVSVNATRTIAATPTPAQSPATPTPTDTPALTSEPTPTVTPAPTRSSQGSVVTSTKASSATSNSPTGKLVIRDEAGVIYVVNVDGSGLHAITSGIDPSWSPDGQRIAYVRWSEPWGLFTINADGSGERQLVADKDLRQPDWSPNGDVIAVVKGRLETVKSHRFGPRGINSQPPPPGGGGERQEWVGVLKGVNPDTGAYYDGDYPADKYIESPSWAPDSIHLAFEGKYGLSTTAKGEDPFLLTPALQDLGYSTPAWSPAGDRIAYTREMHGYWEIWSMATDGSDRRSMTVVSTGGGASAYNNVCPAWSPDGQYIAFLTDRSGEWEVWVMAVPDGTGADGTDQHKLFDLPMALTYGFNGDRMLDWGR